MAKDFVGILFGVEGGKSLSGKSAILIKEQLDSLADKIKLKVNIDKKYFSDQLNSLRKDLEKKLGNLEITIKQNVVEETKKDIEKNGKKAENTSVKSVEVDSSETKEETKDVKELTKELETLYKKRLELAKLKKNTLSRSIYKEEAEGEKTLKQQIEEKTEAIKEALGAESEEFKALKKYQAELERTTKLDVKRVEQQQSLKGNKPADSIAEAKLVNKAQGLYTEKGFDKIIARSQEAKNIVDDFNQKVSEALNKEGGATVGEIKRLNSECIQVENQLQKIGRETETIGTKLREAFSTKLLEKLVYVMALAVGNALRKVYQNVVELDGAIVDLRIATGATKEETEKLVKTYAKLAQEVGATVTEVAEAADTWLRQGYTIAETNKLIVNTMMLSKLGQLESAEAAKALTSAMKGYKVEVADSLGIVDKFTAVDMEAAVSAGGIATAMAETAASAEVAGISMDKLIGYIATVAEVTQDGEESVGTFYKTLFARMGNVAAGKDIDDEGESLSDVDTVLTSLGFRLRDAQGEFRNFGTVLDEVGAKWETFTSVQQHQIATAFAGTRQQEKFIVLMENYADALEYAGVAANSSGTAQSKFDDIYKGSLEAKINNLTGAWQSFSNAVLDSDLVKTGLDILSGFVNALEAIFANTHLMSGAFAIIATMGLGALFTKITTGALLLGKALKGVGISFYNVFKGGTGAKFAEASVALNKIKQEAIEAKDAFKALSERTGLSEEELRNRYEQTKKKSVQSLTDEGFFKTRVDKKDKDGNVIGKKTVSFKKDLIKYGKQEEAVLRKQAKAQAEYEKQVRSATTAVNVMSGALMLGLGVLSSFEEDGWKITTVVVGITVAVLALTAVIHTVAKAVASGVKTIGEAIKSLPILAIISTILTAIMAVIEAFTWLSKADERAAEEAKEHAEKLQEEADALKEISDKAKEATKSISELTNEVTELVGEMNRAEWDNYLKKYGEQIAAYYPNETLSALEAINKILGENYTYDELMVMSEQKRLELTQELLKASAKMEAISAKEALQAQIEASSADIDAVAKKLKADKIKLNFDYSNPAEFIEGLEEQFKYNPNKVEENLVEAREALRKEEAAFLAYLNALSNSEGYKVSVDIDAEDLIKEYNDVYSQIAKAVGNDEIIKSAIENKSLTEANIDEYVKSFIATNYSDLYEAVYPAAFGVAAKSLVKVLEETQDEYETLYDAFNEMDENGLLSADTIIELNKEFPELLENLKEAGEIFYDADSGSYKLKESALSYYLSEQSSKYIGDVEKATKQYEEALKTYDASAKTSADWTTLNNALTTLENAIQNAENWRITENTLSSEALREQYTEMLEEQSDALDEQIDRYKDLCDVRKDLLETYQEEINARKELDKKQTKVADLRTQLNLAKMDTSAAGQVRVRELESQLSEAQDELEEYTLERAIEDITKDIDNSITEYETFIQERISEIETTINEIATKSTENIVNAIKESGGTPIVEVNPSANSDEYQASIEAGKTQASEVRDNANFSDNKKEEPAIKVSGKLTEGVSIGSGVSGLSKNARKNDDVDVIIGGTRYDLLAGSKVSDTATINNLGQIAGKEAKSGSVVAYNGALYILDKKNDWRKMASDGDKIDTAIEAYLTALNENSTVTQGSLNTTGEAYRKVLGGGNYLQYEHRLDLNLDGTNYSNLKLGTKLSSAEGEALSAMIKGNPVTGSTAMKSGRIYAYSEMYGGGWYPIETDVTSEFFKNYLERLKATETHHTGGFAGDITSLKSNEVFAKLLRGELVSTPRQMDNFINNTLPNIVNSANNGGATISYNSPLVSIQCGSVTENTMPELKNLVDKAVKQIERNMESALSRTGYRKKY